METRVPQYTGGFGKSYAMFSAAPEPDTAVIFVHGFGGKPTSTWRNFQGLVDEYSADFKWWAASDMFFYNYDSLQTPIRRNAGLLTEFVEKVWCDRWNCLRYDIHERKYKDLILAGHSEGGVVIRRMILDRYEALKKTVEDRNPNANPKALNAAMESALDSDFIMRCYVRLFAPACMGTNFSSWVGFLTSFSHFVLATTAASVVRNELLPESPVLKTLQRGTEQAHARFPKVRSLYTRPLFGVPDQIVYSESYEGEEPLWDPGYDHFSVCKPDYSHKRPLEFVSK